MAKKKKISTIVVKEAANRSNPEEGIINWEKFSTDSRDR
jgi:hypothetical protein